MVENFVADVLSVLAANNQDDENWAFGKGVVFENHTNTLSTFCLCFMVNWWVAILIASAVQRRLCTSKSEAGVKKRKEDLGDGRVFIPAHLRTSPH